MAYWYNYPVTMTYRFCGGGQLDFRGNEYILNRGFLVDARGGRNTAAIKEGN